MTWRTLEYEADGACQAARGAARASPSFGGGGEEALWQYVRRLRGDWPSARDRSEDLAHHVELKGKRDRARHALTTR